MASKTKKQQSAAAATSTTSIEIASTPSQSSSQQSTPSRPVSPARLSRIQERCELQNLNDRLAAYIDRNRQLEKENSVLKIQVQKKEQTREFMTIKNLYETELGDTRASLDAIAKEKAHVELLLTRTQEELKRLENKLSKKISETATLEKKVLNQDAQIEELRNKINQLNSDKKGLEGNIKSLNDEIKSLDDKVECLKKQLEEETLLRVDLENRNQSLNEELQFQRQLYKKELEEVRMKEFEYKETFQESLKDQYEQKLNKELDELRTENDERIHGYRLEMEEKYEVQLGSLGEQLERKNADLATANSRIKQLNSTYTFINTEVDQLKRDNQSLKDKVEDLNKLLKQEQEWNKISLERKDEEFQALQSTFESLNDEHKDLIDDKIKLDAELAVYRKLLEGEETRLNISPTISSSFNTSTMSQVGSYTPKIYTARGNKRKRICLQDEENLFDVAVVSNAKGDIVIFDHDQEGKFVKLKNNSEDKDISIGGWQLQRTADGLETHYKFHRSIILKPGATITVWSSNANAFHQPPNEVVMKSQAWFTADKMTTSLVNSNGEEVATRTTEKKISSRSQRFSSSYLDDDVQGDDQQKCLIM
ncbi:intermediate filament [Blomia tropicalis]|nr:intermediate filament [Blomia tropicalis]